MHATREFILSHIIMVHLCLCGVSVMLFPYVSSDLILLVYTSDTDYYSTSVELLFTWVAKCCDKRQFGFSLVGLEIKFKIFIRLVCRPLFELGFVQACDWQKSKTIYTVQTPHTPTQTHTYPDPTYLTISHLLSMTSRVWELAGGLWVFCWLDKTSRLKSH